MPETIVYNMIMKTLMKEYIIKETEIYTSWFNSLKGKNAKVSIGKRIDRMKDGNFGDYKPLKGVSNIFELRIDYGLGYRVYFKKRGNEIIILLCGGVKKSQTRDIEKAKIIASEV